jgi:hypothetical protein
MNGDHAKYCQICKVRHKGKTMHAVSITGMCIMSFFTPLTMCVKVNNEMLDAFRKVYPDGELSIGDHVCHKYYNKALRQKDDGNRTKRRRESVDSSLVKESTSMLIAEGVVQSSVEEVLYDQFYFYEFAPPHVFAGCSVGKVFLEVCSLAPTLALTMQNASDFRKVMHDYGVSIAHYCGPPVKSVLREEIEKLCAQFPLRDDCFDVESVRLFRSEMMDAAKYPMLHEIILSLVVSQ